MCITGNDIYIIPPVEIFPVYFHNKEFKSFAERCSNRVIIAHTSNKLA